MNHHTQITLIYSFFFSTSLLTSLTCLPNSPPIAYLCLSTSFAHPNTHTHTFLSFTQLYLIQIHITASNAKISYRVILFFRRRRQSVHLAFFVFVFQLCFVLCFFVTVVIVCNCVSVVWH